MGSMSMEMRETDQYNSYQNEDSTSIEKVNISQMPVSCWECNTIHDGEACWNLGKNTTNINEYSHMQRSCPAEQPYCKVRHFVGFFREIAVIKTYI